MGRVSSSASGGLWDFRVWGFRVQGLGFGSWGLGL